MAIALMGPSGGSGLKDVVIKTANWSANKNWNGSATVNTTVSVDFSELKLTKAPSVHVYLGSTQLYGQDNGVCYASVSLSSVTTTKATANVAYQYVGTSIGNGSGSVAFVIAY